MYIDLTSGLRRRLSEGNRLRKGCKYAFHTVSYVHISQLEFLCGSVHVYHYLFAVCVLLSEVKSTFLSLSHGNCVSILMLHWSGVWQAYPIITSRLVGGLDSWHCPNAFQYHVTDIVLLEAEVARIGIEPGAVWLMACTVYHSATQPF